MEVSNIMMNISQTELCVNGLDLGGKRYMDNVGKRQLDIKNHS